VAAAVEPVVVDEVAGIDPFGPAARITRTIASVASTIEGSRRSPAEIERGSWKIAARIAG
jgi:hypothetical protein